MKQEIATIGKATPGLSDHQRDQLVTLIGGADSLELKLTVPESDHHSAVVALGMDPLAAEIRQVYFFDTPDLALNQAGVVVRGRRVQGRTDDSVVKLRPVVPDQLPKSLRASPNLVVEVDGMPGGFVCSASLKAACGTNDVRRVAADTRPIRKLFSKEQRQFLRRARPRRDRARRPLDLWPHPRVQAEVRAGRLRPPPGRRAVELPGWIAHPRTLDEVRAETHSEDGQRNASVLGDARRITHRRATNQDQDRPGVLREAGDR